MKARPIVIVGGGLAGLTLGLLLRRREVPVAVIEAGVYPRHRVCGEFINGRGLDVLADLGVLASLKTAGGCAAATAIFCVPDSSSPVRRLPKDAFCVSRFLLDASLARSFVEQGGRLVEGNRWQEEFAQPGCVRATGRRPNPGAGGPRWFGVKAHARQLPLEADLEMHFGPRGYVGICRVEGGRANVCGLFRESESAGSGTGAGRVLKQLVSGAGADLRARLECADWDLESVCTVAGLPLHVGLREAEASPDECAIGDAAAMIPPVTGNGMSMAFESAALAVDPLADYAGGQLGWEDCCRAVADRERRHFARRLRWANTFHRWLFRPVLGRCLLYSAARSSFLWRTSFVLTR